MQSARIADLVVSRGLEQSGARSVHKVARNGSLIAVGTWSWYAPPNTQSAQPLPGAALAATQSTIYEISSVKIPYIDPRTYIYMADVSAEGTVGRARIVNMLPTPRQFAQATASRGYLYVAGGSLNVVSYPFDTLYYPLVSATSSVLYAEISPPVVSGVSTSLVAAGRATTITLTGANLSASPTVRLGSGAPLEVLAATATSVIAVVPATQAAGTYSLIVTRPDGRVASFSSVIVDGTAPTGSLVVNDGAAFIGSTNVALTLSATDDTGTVALMAFSNDGVTFSTPESFAASKSWSVPSGDGTKRVYVTFTDLVGNTTVPISATFMLDSTPPSGTLAVTGETTRTTTSVGIALSASDAGSGVAQMSFSNDGAAWSNWESYATSKTWAVLGGNGSKTVYARFSDRVGNISNPATASVTVSEPLPSGSVVANGGALTTTSRGITLALSGSAGVPSYTTVSMAFSNDTLSWSAWQPFGATATWSLALGDGSKTVYARFQDSVGNVSQSASTTISLDTSVQSEYVVSISGGALYTNTTGVVLKIGSRAGTTQMQLSNDGGFSIGEWEPYVSTHTWTITQYGNYVIPRSVYVRFKDADGTVTGTFTDDIILDVTPPNGSVRASQRTSAGRQAAAAVAVLDINASDDGSGVAAMQVSGSDAFSGAVWELLAARRDWSFDSGPKVHVRFRDNVGNVSGTYSADSPYASVLPTSTPSSSNSATSTPLIVATATNSPLASTTSTPTVVATATSSPLAPVTTATPTVVAAASTVTRTPLVPRSTLPPTVALTTPVSYPTGISTPNASTGGQAYTLPTMAANTTGVAVIQSGSNSPFTMSLIVYVPRTGQTPIGIRVQPSTLLDAGVTPPAGSTIAKVVSIDVYDAATGGIIHDHAQPLELTIQLTAGEMTLCATDPGRVALLHIDSTGRVTRLAPSNSDYCTTGVIKASLSRTSSIAVAQLRSSTDILLRLFVPIGLRASGGW